MELKENCESQLFLHWRTILEPLSRGALTLMSDAVLSDPLGVDLDLATFLREAGVSDVTGELSNGGLGLLSDLNISTLDLEILALI